MIGLGTLLHYSARLVYEIYLAGLGVIPTIIFGEVDAQLIETETKLTDELLIDILANSITLPLELLLRIRKELYYASNRENPSLICDSR